MHRTVQLVATEQRIQRDFPGAPAPRGKPGIMSAQFPIDPAKCESKFGRWLAERVRTTRFDDDLSQLRVTLRHTEEDLHVRELAQRITGSSVRSAADAESLHQLLAAWVERRRNVIACYGPEAFRPRVEDFQWPVYGSAFARGAETPEEFFDVCGRLIRRLQPARVVLWDGQEPPEQLQVCNSAMLAQRHELPDEAQQWIDSTVQPRA